VEDVAAGGEVKTRGIIVQKKTGRPVQFEITEQTRTAVAQADGSLLSPQRRLSISQPPRRIPSLVDAAWSET
jgi:hypothetical protein